MGANQTTTNEATGLVDPELGVLLASPSVNVRDVVPALRVVVHRLAELHSQMFGRALVITSGKDAVHAPGSLHGEGKAVDYRTNDKTDEENDLFLQVVGYVARLYHSTVFDERALPGGPHVHIEYHGA
jgi:hypothetical protein